MADLVAYVYNPSIYGIIDSFVINVDATAIDGIYVRESSLGSDFFWTNGMLDVSIVSTDASVNDLYNYVEDLSTYAHAPKPQDPSIDNLYDIKLEASDLAPYATNASVGLALQPYTTKAYVDGSIWDVLVYVDTQDSDLYFYVDGSLFKRDLSINWLYTNKLEASSLTPFATNSSVNLALQAYSTKAYVDGSLSARDTSIAYLNSNKIDATALQPYATNSSVNSALGSYIKSASTGTGLYWSGSLLNASVGTGDVTKAYVDGSLSARDVSIAWLRSKTSQIDASIIRIDASLNNTIAIDGLFVTNSSLATSLAPYATNVSVNTALTTVNASIGLLVTKNNNQDTSINAEHVYTDQHWIDINRMGFLNQTETTIAFDGVKIFTLAPVSATWSYYRLGIKYTITGTKTIDLTTVDATLVDGAKYFIRLNSNDGTLSASKTPWTLLDAEIPVAIVAWNNTLNPKFFLQEERHSILIDRREHLYLHATRGTQYVSGGELTGYTFNSTYTDANNTFVIGQSVIADEDIMLTVPLQTDGGGVDASNYVVMNRTGIGNWAWTYSDVPFRYTANYIQYDNAGTLTEGINNRFYNTYLIITNTVGIGRHVVVCGQTAYTSAVNAYAEVFANMDLVGFPKTEWLGLYQLTWQTNSTASNKGKVRLTRAAQRITTSAITASATTAVPHNTLLGLQGGNVINSNFYHLDLSTYNTLPYFMTDTSVTALGYATNASINAAKFVKEASLYAGTFVWNAGYLDVSVAGSGATVYDKIDGGNDWTNPTLDIVNGGTW